ncbi:MAG: HEAT repeat domain-containing protein [Betaproteobacteria bacterium]
MKSLLLILVLAAALSGCAPSSYVVRSPSPSGQKFEAAANAAPVELPLRDNRSAGFKQFHYGVLPSTLHIESGALEPLSFLQKNLQAELLSRGIPIQIGKEGGAGGLYLNNFQIENYRTNAYTPYITFTYLSVDLEWRGKTERLVAYIKRGKTPVWSFDEVVDPTYNQPLSLAIQELAAKIAGRIFESKMSDAAVDAFAARTSGASEDDAYQSVYALGFSNNPRAIPIVEKLATDPREYVRLAAISALGILRSQSHFGFLRSVVEERNSLWQDRAMALKAIGDLGTSEALEYLRQQETYWGSQPSSKESVWNLKVIRLYTLPLRGAPNGAPAASAPLNTAGKTAASATPAATAATAASAASAPSVPTKTWVYSYSDMYGKRRQFQVVSSRPSDGVMVDAWSADGGAAGNVRWTSTGPFITSQTNSGVESILVSPFAFDGDGLSSAVQNMRTMQMFGENYRVNVRFIGGDSFQVGEKRLDVTKMEIVSKGFVNSPAGSVLVGGAPLGFTVQAWYAKELGRVVRVVVNTNGMYGGTNKYTLVLSGGRP